MSIEVGMQIKRRGRPPKISIQPFTEENQAIVDRFGANEQLAQQLAHWAYRLELAAHMKAGVMDSDSRHQEVANTIRDIVLSVVSEMRQ